MQENESFLPKDLYLAHLTTINGINFTLREVDVMACYLNGRGKRKEIAHFLSISANTVRTHIQNINKKTGAERLLDFIEKSSQYSLIKNNYYSNLRTYLTFEKTLKEVFKLKRSEQPKCLVIYLENQDLKKALLQHLSHHLQQVGIKAEVRDYNNNQKIEVKENLGYCLIFLLPKEEKEKSFQGVTGFSSADLSGHKNYYLALFEIFKSFISSSSVDGILLNFQNQSQGLKYISKSEKYKAEEIEINKDNTIFLSMALFLKEKWHVAFGLCILGLGSVGALVFSTQHELNQNTFQTYSTNPKTNSKASIRSDLIIPTESSFLPRPELIEQIDSKLKNQNGIQTLALVGPGGAGKTTLARQYAHQRKVSVVWEINAETQESLRSSFENLAQALAKTEEDKNALKEIQDVKDAKKREGKVIQFVKEHLNSYSNWFLIFDNVEKFSDIQKYYPQDSRTWGQGKIILTTRNNNIENNKHINGIIQIGALSPPQKLTLFTKITTHGKETYFTPLQTEELKAFLEHIPSFPLDVSVAAYYLKATHISYTAYLENLTKYNKEFESVQQNLLKEAGDYTKTRYGIISLSLNHMMNIHKDFRDLLLFISLLDSQNISRSLLVKYKDKEVVDNFFYHLHKYSLVIPGLTHSPANATFSIHRSTQAIILAHLTKTLGLKKNKYLLEPILNALEKYLTEIVEREDSKKMKSLVHHYEAVLSHNNLLKYTTAASIRGGLGCIYFYLSDYIKAKQLLERSIGELNKSFNNYYRIAQAEVYLGIIYRELGYYERAIQLFKHSLCLYKKYFPENRIKIAHTLAHLGLAYETSERNPEAVNLLRESLRISKQYLNQNPAGIARTSRYLGMVYRKIGEYEEAEHLLIESLRIYKKYFSENDVGTAWALLHLGNLYRILGQYEKARELLEQGLEIFRTNFSKTHNGVAWSLLYLGDIYRSLGDYKKAENLLEESLRIYKAKFPEKHGEIARTLRYLGAIYINLGHYEKAKVLFEKSLEIYRALPEESSMRTSWTLAHLGYVYAHMGDYKRAEIILRESLEKHKRYLKKNHPKIACISLWLGIVYANLGYHEIAKSLFEKNFRLYERHYGKSHIRTAEILRELGHVYLLEGDFEKAEDSFHKALTIFQKNNHPNTYKVLEDFAELHLKKTTLEKKSGDNKQSESFKIQAISCLKQALNIVKTHFPKDSPHIMRIEAKIRKIEKEIQ